MTSRLTLISHAVTSATRRAAFPIDEPIETAPSPVAMRADVYLTAPETSCRQTAKALGLATSVDRALRGCDYGTWRGRTLDELTASDPDSVTRWLTEPSAAPHGGESTLDLLARVSSWLDSIPRDQGRIVAVTHTAVIKAAVVHAILATPQSFWRFDVPALSMTVLSGRPASWTLRTLAVPLDPTFRQARGATTPPMT